MRLLVVAVVIAAIVGLGYLWRSSSLASIITDGGGDRRPPDGGGDRFDRFRDSGAFSLGNIDELLQTMFIGVAVLAGVVFIDRARRQRRPVDPSQR